MASPDTASAALAPRDLLGPVEDLHPPVEMLDQRGAAFDPVAVVPVFDAVEQAEFGGVDVAADTPSTPRGAAARATTSSQR